MFYMLLFINHEWRSVTGQNGSSCGKIGHLVNPSLHRISEEIRSQFDTNVQETEYLFTCYMHVYMCKYTCMCIYACACTHICMWSIVHVSECVSDYFNLLCVLHLSYSNHFSNVCIVGGSMNPYKKWFCRKSEVGDKHTCKNTPKCSTQCFHKESHESYIPTLSPQWNNIQTEKA